MSDDYKAKWEAADAALTKLKADRNQSHLEALDELEEALFGKTGNTWQKGQGDRVSRVLMRCYTAGLYTADKQLAEADAARRTAEQERDRLREIVKDLLARVDEPSQQRLERSGSIAASNEVRESDSEERQ